MNKYLFASVTCAVLLAACSGARVAPTSMEDDLVAAHVAAQGGLEKIQAINTLEMRGEVELPMMGMTLPLEISMKRPNKVLSEVEVQAAGMVVRSGYDGETAWTNNPMLGSDPVKLGGAQARLLKQQADIDGILVDYKKEGMTLTYDGEADVRGAKARKLRLTRPDSSTVLVYLDAGTSLITRVDAIGINPSTGTPMPTQTYFLDYRDVEGVKRPYRMEIEANGQIVQKMTLEAIHANRPLNDDLFAFPGK